MGDAKEELICVGAVAGAYGVRGEARIKSFCAEPADIALYAPLLDESGARSFTLRITGAIAGGFSARLGGVSTREAAAALKGLRLHAPRDRMPALPDDEFYHADLIGLAAVDTGGAPLGRISAVEDFGAGDFLEIARPGAAPLLVPFTREAAPTVDLAAGRVVIDPPEDVAEDAPKDGPGTGR